jgi:hypothetical protein
MPKTSTWMIARLLAVPAITQVITGCVVSPSNASDIPAPEKALLECIYHLLKSKAEVQSVEVYARDDWRFAFEYTTRDTRGQVLISDLMLFGNSWNMQPQHGESTETGFKELDFLTKSFPDMDSKCHVSPAGDYLLPGPKPRAEWRQIELGN